MKLIKQNANHTNNITQTQHGNVGQTGQVTGSEPLVMPDAPTPTMPAPGTRPVDGILSDADLAKIAGVGGVGLAGQGHLTGIVGFVKQGEVNFGIATLVEKPILITANHGNSAEVTFILDLPHEKAKALEGQKITVSGEINKESPRMGTISGVEVEETQGLPARTWKEVSGTVENRNIMAIGGEAPPSGSYLKLDQPIKVDGQEVTEVFVQNKEWANGTAVKLSGRLDPRTYGGVETPESKYVALTGVTDQTAGEPRFDGKVFRDAHNKELEVLSYVNPMIADIPSTIFVLDQGADKAWIGKSGGFIPEWVNGFHGFNEARAIANPTEADRAQVKFLPDGTPTNASGTELELISLSEPLPGTADGMSTAWYLDTDNGNAYRVQNGGIAGFSNFIDQVIKMGE